MKLHLGQDGKPVFENGLPLYEYEDGSKAPFDAKATVEGLNAKIKAESEIKARFERQREEALSKYKPFEGLNPTEVSEALKLKKNLTDKQLLDANGVDELKRQMKIGFEDEKGAIQRSFEETLNKFKSEKENLQDIIFKLAIKNRLATSPYFAGEKPKTIYSPEDAHDIFGRRFKIEIVNGEVREVALDEKGKPLMSKKNHGEPADFDEAIALMVEAKNKTHNIMAGAGGRGPRGGHSLGDNDGEADPKDSKSLIRQGLKKRMAALGR